MLVQMCLFYLTVNILLKLFWITIDFSFLVNKGVQFFLHDICHFFVFIAHLSMKIILVDPNLMHTYFGNNFFDPNYGAHPWK